MNLKFNILTKPVTIRNRFRRELEKLLIKYPHIWFTLEWDLNLEEGEIEFYKKNDLLFNKIYKVNIYRFEENLYTLWDKGEKIKYDSMEDIITEIDNAPIEYKKRGDNI